MQLTTCPQPGRAVGMRTPLSPEAGVNMGGGVGVPIGGGGLVGVTQGQKPKSGQVGFWMQLTTCPQPGRAVGTRAHVSLQPGVPVGSQVGVRVAVGLSVSAEQPSSAL